MKKLQKILGKSFKAVIFIIATIIWSVFVYTIDGEWLYFVPLIAGDILFWRQFLGNFGKRKNQNLKKTKSELNHGLTPYYSL